MNLYQLHSETRLLELFEEAHECVPCLFWEKYDGLPSELKKRQAAIALSPKYAALYAIYTLDGPFPAGEAAIAKDSWQSYRYARYAVKDKFPAGEAAIAKSVWSYYYAATILHAPFPAGEAAIAKDDYLKIKYYELLASLKK